MRWSQRLQLRLPRGGDGNRRQRTTDHALNEGPLPTRITRSTYLQMGKTGPNVNTFPMTHGMEFVGHVPLVVVGRLPTPQPGNQFDDRVSVPASFAGNPLP